MTFNALKDLLNVDSHCVDRNLSNTDRYMLFKIGPILICCHGIGTGSISVFMNELLKLLWLSESKNARIVRVGTCGGLGHQPGTIAITKSTVNGALKAGFEFISCGNERLISTESDNDLNDELREILVQMNQPHVFGTTMTTDDFYEAQGRCDGAFCDFSKKEQKDFLQKAHIEHKVQNIEMEASTFLAFCRRAQVPGAVVCVILLNRLERDQITSSHDELNTFEEKLIDVVIKLVLKHVAR